MRGTARMPWPAPVPDDYSDWVNGICRYLALDDFGHRRPGAHALPGHSGAPRFDLVAVFGNQVLATIALACELYVQGLAGRLLFSGGVGHSTPLLFDNIRRSTPYARLVKSGVITAGMAEADMMAAVATVAAGVPLSAIRVENRSTNTGENARFSCELIGAQLPGVSSILLIQDPLLQRRSALTMAQAMRVLPGPPLLLSHAVFVPQVAGGEFVTPLSASERPPWEPARFLALLMGEVERLRNDERGYGPRGRGFLPAVEVPADVLASYDKLRVRIAGNQAGGPVLR
jgi:uncharacterized SAM-binding protein YcdF (DUF218 family)